MYGGGGWLFLSNAVNKKFVSYKYIQIFQKKGKHRRKKLDFVEKGAHEKIVGGGGVGYVAMYLLCIHSWVMINEAA